MSTILNEFIDRARDVSFSEACDRLKIPDAPKGKTEYQGPCPAEGGKDRFSVNRKKGVWNCRGCSTGGHDGIGLAAHVAGLDLRNRAQFLLACAAVLCEPVPSEGERETDEEREARYAHIVAARARAEQRRAENEKSADDYRAKEIGKARGLWLQAVDCGVWCEGGHGQERAVRGATVIGGYLKARTGFDVPGGVFDHLRFIPACSYWHGQDDLGRPVSIHSGPAMVAPFVDPAGRIVGCHLTWIDLGRAPKHRPFLYALTAEGLRAGRRTIAEGGNALPPSAEELNSGFYELLPTKKMRGAKKGGLIPVCGDPEAGRWVGGEGIESVVAIAGPEGFRADTFYFAAGDIGNLAGPADPDSAFFHPTLKKQDTAGRWKRVKVKGPVPRQDLGPEEAVQVPDHVAELVLIADGDSEPVATASDMARAEARLGREGRTVTTWWPPEGQDFADAMVAAMAQADGTKHD